MAKVESGEEIIIARSGKPIARLCALAGNKKQPKRKPGFAKGIIPNPEALFDPALEREIEASFIRILPMRILIDSHIFVWWADGKPLSVRVKRILADPSTDLLFSLASAWELALKIDRLGWTGRFEPLVQSGIRNSE